MKLFYNSIDIEKQHATQNKRLIKNIMVIRAANRYQAFGIHIVISALIFIILASIIVFVWYPEFLFETDGGWEGIRLIASVDFIIGPTLTLIIYKVGKAGLKFDLFLIGLIQFCCLFAGSWVVYQERPVAIIYVNGVFQTMSKDSFDFHEININEVFKLDNKIPAWVYVELPQDKSERKEILKNQLNDGLIHARADLYRPYKENLQIILQENIDLTLVDEDIIKTLSDSGILFNYKARYGIGYIEINKDTGDYIAIH